MVLGFTWLDVVVQSFYWVQVGFTMFIGFYWVLSGYPRVFGVLLGFY